MDNITKATRYENYLKVEPKQKSRQQIILDVLGDRQMTVSEITEELIAIGVIRDFNRNFVAPRLTELKGMGILKTVGRRKATRTKATEAVWERVSEGKAS